MTWDYLIGAAVATYLLVAVWLASEGAKGWEWLAIALWPIAIPAVRTWRLRMGGRR